MKKLLCLALCWGLLFQAAIAIDVIIPGTKRIGDVPTDPGTGLCATYWDTPGFLFTNVEAHAFAAANDPQATWISALVDYVNGPDDVASDDTTLFDWLGIDGTSLTPGSAGSNIVETSLWRYQGAIAVRPEYDVDLAAPGIQVLFSLGSDDGSGFHIADIEVINNEGDHGYGYADRRVAFELPGLYPVDLIHYENFGVTGVEWYSTIPGGPDYGAPNPGMGIVPTANLYCVVPEPATLSLIALGLGLVAVRRRKSAP